MAKAAAPTTPKSIFRIFVAPTFIPVAGLQQTAGDSAIDKVWLNLLVTAIPPN
jgi:hypothetical protein